MYISASTLGGVEDILIVECLSTLRRRKFVDILLVQDDKIGRNTLLEERRLPFSCTAVRLVENED